ncbi:peptidyl-tRNA hydrolase [Candidatus Bathyarchaeota archaeon]|nr:MAG: peptidyl-tRNA hydrolase [Candidatus Bathyarchaeota archaeon]
MTNSRENRRYKQVLVVRSDLKMGKGKIAVQCSHAAVSASEEARKSSLDWWRIWMHEGQSKVAVKVSGLSPILDLERRSRENGLPFYVVRDMGLTQVEPGTVTCIGIGPGPVVRVDLLTGDLPLL